MRVRGGGGVARQGAPDTNAGERGGRISLNEKNGKDDHVRRAHDRDRKRKVITRVR